MIYCLTGELIFLDAVTNTAVIECGGVGYRLQVSAKTCTKLSTERGRQVRLYTYMAVREDSVELFGFYTTQEQDTFRLLIGVSGVGPKAAVSMLSVMSPEELAGCVAREDAKAIARAPGVGAKTAARVVLELKDKLAAGMTGDNFDKSAPAAGGSSLSDARDALLVLGYGRSEVMAALKGISPDTDTEDIIRTALAKLMK